MPETPRRVCGPHAPTPPPPPAAPARGRAGATGRVPPYERCRTPIARRARQHTKRRAAAGGIGGARVRPYREGAVTTWVQPDLVASPGRESGRRTSAALSREVTPGRGWVPGPRRDRPCPTRAPDGAWGVGLSTRVGSNRLAVPRRAHLGMPAKREDPIGSAGGRLAARSPNRGGVPRFPSLGGTKRLARPGAPSRQ